MPPPAWLTQALAVDYDSFLPLRAAERRFGWVRPEFAAVLARVAARLRDEGVVTAGATNRTRSTPRRAGSRSRNSSARR